MRSKLFYKVFLIIFFNLVILLLFLTIYLITDKKNSLEKEFLSKASNIVTSIIVATSDAFVVEDLTYLLEYNLVYLAENKNVETIIIEGKNEKQLLVMSRDKWNFVTKNQVKFSNSEKNRDRVEILVDFNKGEYYVFPIKISGLLFGKIYISLNKESYMNAFNRLYFDFMILALLFIIMSLLLAFLIARYFTKPIIDLNNIVKEITQNKEFSKRIGILSDNEIGELGKSFNKMMDSIEKHHFLLHSLNERLEEKVEKRTAELKKLNMELDKRINLAVLKYEKQFSLLVQQSRLVAMSEIISVLAHQWRQPLNALGIIIQNIEFLNELDLIEKEKLRDNCKDSSRMIYSMSNTINQVTFLLNETTYEEFDILTTIQEIVELFRKMFEERKIKMVLSNINNNQTLLYGEKQEFVQLFISILMNSYDVLSLNCIPNAMVEINIKQGNKKVIIEILDNGGGVDEKLLEKIYEPYFSTKNNENGSGLGLYIAKMIIEKKFNGKIITKNHLKGLKTTLII